MYKAIDVANYVISYTNKLKKPVTNLKLQKMLYFIQGFSYAQMDKRFIDEEFEAWPYGPVIRSAYIYYSIFGSFTIKTIEQSNSNIDKFSEEDKNFLDEIILKLNMYTASQLVKASHTKGSPWNETFEKKGPKSIIDDSLIEKYFKENASGK